MSNKSLSTSPAQQRHERIRTCHTKDNSTRADGVVEPMENILTIKAIYFTLFVLETSLDFFSTCIASLTFFSLIETILELASSNFFSKSSFSVVIDDEQHVSGIVASSPVDIL